MKEVSITYQVFLTSNTTCNQVCDICSKTSAYITTHLFHKQMYHILQQEFFFLHMQTALNFLKAGRLKYTEALTADCGNIYLETLLICLFLLGCGYSYTNAGINTIFYAQAYKDIIVQ